MTRVAIGHPLNAVLSYSAEALHSAVPPGRGLRLWISRPEQPSRHKQHERTGHCKHAEATRRGRVLVVGVVSVRACPAQTRRVLFTFREASKARINGMVFWEHRVSGKRFLPGSRCAMTMYTIMPATIPNMIPYARLQVV